MCGVGYRWNWKPKCNHRTRQRSLKCGLRNQDKTRVKCSSKSSVALLYKRTSKERRTGNPQIPTTSLYIQFVCHCQIVSYAAIYHLNPSSWSEAPSAEHFMSTTMPHHPMLQHLRPHHYHPKYSHHHHTIFLYLTSGLSTCLPFHNTISFPLTWDSSYEPSLIMNCNLSRDSIPYSGLRPLKGPADQIMRLVSTRTTILHPWNLILLFAVDPHWGWSINMLSNKGIIHHGI